MVLSLIQVLFKIHKICGCKNDSHSITCKHNLSSLHHQGCRLFTMPCYFKIECCTVAKEKIEEIIAIVSALYERMTGKQLVVMDIKRADLTPLVNGSDVDSEDDSLGNTLHHRYSEIQESAEKQKILVNCLKVMKRKTTIRENTFALTNRTLVQSYRRIMEP
eukprot:TRINITY_DN1198_c0_g1_i1.p1 TRINITY_DN1198_c0_g1~~TRINITY_DN1198_c0_g1_i1.p1  ORF type:complete len:162 (+),score=17.80 TRINITY_DN1198_c0_g1_i1:86-571(+)